MGRKGAETQGKELWRESRLLYLLSHCSLLIQQKSAVGRKLGLALAGIDSDPQHVCNFHMQLLKVDRVVGYPNMSVHQF